MDFDVRDFNGSGSAFVSKSQVGDGVLDKRITAVEQAEGLPRNGRPAVPELVLLFSDGGKFGLRTRANRDALEAAFGPKTSAWIGKRVEIYVDPTVRSPQGQRVGGLRLRIPEQDAGVPADFQSDLEDDALPF